MQTTKFTMLRKPFTFISEVREKLNIMLSNFIDKESNASAGDTPTINAEIGTINASATAIAGLATRTVTVTNNKVKATSIVFAVVKGYGGAGNPTVQQVDAVAAGSFEVLLLNTHATAATDAAISIFFIVF